MLKIGLTGGIGSGKSYVAGLLRARGIPVYDSDIEAKRIMDSDPCVIDEITSLLGNKIVKNRAIDKSALADVLFNDRYVATRIEEIIHPKVIKDFQNWCAKQETAICAIESAILIEAGLMGEVDFIVVVDAPENLRLKRTLARNKITSSMFYARTALQIEQKEKIKKADFVILNDGVAELELQIDNLLKKLENKLQ